MLVYITNTMQLDDIDYRILSFLTINSRTSYQQISQALKISPDTISYRIKNLKENKVIKDYMLMIDARKLGLIRYHVLLRLKGDSKLKQKICNNFKKHESIMWINSFVGSYDFQIILDEENPHSLSKTLKDINKKCSGNLLDYHVLTHLYDYEFTNQFPKLNYEKTYSQLDDSSFSKFFTSRSYAVSDTFKIFPYKLLDLKILKFLAEDPNSTISDLSKKVGSDRVTTKKHLSELLANKVITSFATIVDLKIFNRITHYFLVKLRPTISDKEITSAIKKLDNVFYSGKMLGDYDLIVYLNSSSSTELYNSVEVLKNSLEKFIIKYEILVVDEIYHWNHFTSNIYKSCEKKL